MLKRIRTRSSGRMVFMMSTRPASSPACAPPARMHLGHYHGALKNWVRLQDEYECFFFVADWHALTTHYEEPRGHRADTSGTWSIDWLAAGIDPDAARRSSSSRRCPSTPSCTAAVDDARRSAGSSACRPTRTSRRSSRTATSRPTASSAIRCCRRADILIYRAALRAGRRGPGRRTSRSRARSRAASTTSTAASRTSRSKAEAAVKKLGSTKAQALSSSCARRSRSRATPRRSRRRARCSTSSRTCRCGDRERLLGYLEGGGKTILPEPQALLTEAPKLPGLDGQKMSKSYGNTIVLREEPAEVDAEDPHDADRPGARAAHRPGQPGECPVWQLHQVYSTRRRKRLGRATAARPPASAASNASSR